VSKKFKSFFTPPRSFLYYRLADTSSRLRSVPRLFYFRSLLNTPLEPTTNQYNMEIAFPFTKKRSEFGKHIVLSNGETSILESIPSTHAYEEDHLTRTTTATGIDNAPQLSVTEVNTERIVMKNTGMQHKEGGWPKDVDFTEQSDVKRFRKKVEKDEEYQYAMKQLVPMVQRCMNQNNTVNIYERYFDGNETDHCSEPPFAKGLAVFRDPSQVTRPATSVNWHPEGSNSGKMAVSYSVLNFQDERLGNSEMLASVRY